MTLCLHPLASSGRYCGLKYGLYVPTIWLSQLSWYWVKWQTRQVKQLLQIPGHIIIHLRREVKGEAYNLCCLVK